MKDHLFDLYTKIEEAKFNLHLCHNFPNHTKNVDVEQNKVDLLEEEFQMYVEENQDALKKEFSKDTLKNFIEDSYKFLIKPRYGIQSIYEDYGVDEIEMDDNLILQRELRKYHYGRYQSLFSETHKNYRKMLFILKMVGDLHVN